MPATDWLGGPDNRFHRIFEDVPFSNCDVHVIEMKLGPPVRTSRLNLHRALSVHTGRSLSLFYLLNTIPLWYSIVSIVGRIRPAVIITSNPVLAFPLAQLKQFFGYKLIFDYVDDMSSLAVQYAPRLLKPAIGRLVRCMLRTLLRLSDRVVVSSRSLEALCSKMTRAPPIYIPNGVFLSSFAGGAPKRNSPRVGYVGGIYEWSGVDELIRSYPDVSKHIPSVEYHIFGSGIYERKIRRMAREYDRVIFHGRVHYSRVPEIMKSFSVGVIPFHKTTLADRACPMKLFEYWAAGVPVISRDLIEVRTVGADACAFYRRTSELSTTIVRLLSDSHLCRMLVSKGHQLVRSHDWPALARRYFTVIQSILG